MQCNSYIYEHIRSDTHEVYYVGKGTGKRAWTLSHGRNPWHRHVQEKLKEIGAETIVSIFLDGLTEEFAFRMEAERIKYWRSVGAPLANLTDGGEGPSNPSEETREKMRAAKIGKKRTEEEKQKISDTLKAVLAALPEKEKERRAEAARSRMTGATLENAIRNLSKYSDCPDRKRKVAEAQFGRVLTEEQKQRLRELRLGVKQSPELIEKRVAPLRGRPRPQSVRNAISAKWDDQRRAALSKRMSISVICSSTGEVFASAKEAGAAMRVDPSCVLKVCKGKLRHARGLVFEYNRSMETKQ